MLQLSALSILTLASLAGLLPQAASTPINQAVRTEPQYGHWDLTYERGAAASGYRWVYVNANYSGPPPVAVACKELYDPSVQTTTGSCSDTSFSYSVYTENSQTCMSFSFRPESRGGSCSSREGLRLTRFSFRTGISVNQTVLVGAAGSATPVVITGKSVMPTQCCGVNGRVVNGTAHIQATAA